MYLTSKIAQKTISLTNGKEVVIREAVATDARELIAYVQKIAGETDFLTLGPGEFSSCVTAEEDYIEDFAAGDNRIFLIAEINGHIIGVSHFGGGETIRMHHTGEFGVGVFKEYWSQGIGLALMEQLLGWARNSGMIRKINLRVHKDNKRAIDLYVRLGFKSEGVKTREFCIDGIFYDAILMGLEID